MVIVVLAMLGAMPLQNRWIPNEPQGRLYLLFSARCCINSTLETSTPRKGANQFQFGIGASALNGSDSEPVNHSDSSPNLVADERINLAQGYEGIGTDFVISDLDIKLSFQGADQRNDRH